MKSSISPNNRSVQQINILSVLLIGLAIVIGGFLLLDPLLRSDFPLNDGGLFYVMVKDLIANSYRLPEYTSYNNANIPFVYPPLPIYLAAFLYDVFDISLLELLRWLPFIFSILALPAFGLLSQSILKSNIRTAISMLSFAILLPPFNRLIMGGGLTRAPGLVFALLALNWIYLMYSEHSRRHVILATVFSVLTVLCHGVYAWFVIFSAGVMFVFSKPRRQDVLNSMLVLAGTLMITIPWYSSIFSHHGFQPVFAAFRSRSALSPIISLGQLLVFDLTHELFLSILGVMAFFGLLLTILNKDFFYLVWLIVIFIFERTMPGHFALIPLAMLIGISVDTLVFNNQWVTNIFGRRVLLIAFSYFLIYSLISASLQPAASHLSEDTRQVMEWVAKNTKKIAGF